MDLPDIQKLFLLAAATVAEEDTDRRMEARAVTDRYDFGQATSDWIFEATRNLGALGFLAPYTRDGRAEDQFVHLTPAGIRKARSFADAGLRVYPRGQERRSVAHSDGSRFSDGTGYVDAGYVEPSYVEDGAVALDFSRPASSVDSSMWTGIASKRDRLVAVRSLFPSAIAAVEAMLSEGGFGHNNGPPLDVDEGTLDALRGLYRALGEILSLADDGALDAGRGPGLINELAVYSRRAMEGLRIDPLKYAVIGGLTAMGSLIWGPQFLASAALTGAFEAKREGKQR